MWTAIYRLADGVLIGCGTVLPETLPDGTGTKTYEERPDQGTHWDPALLDFVANDPPVLIDRLQDLAGHAYLADVWAKLTTTQRTKLRRAMVWLLGTHRYRQPLEEVALDVDSSWPTDPSTVTE